MKIILFSMYNALYIHVPFCASKCDYCAFYSETETDAEGRQAWLDKVCRELCQNAPRLTTVRTIFIGGGTPTILDSRELESLLSAIRETVCDSRLEEFTLECNPETLTAEKARILAESGVNRVSLGIQSFDQGFRDILGRRGSAESAQSAIECLTNAGIGNLGIDLIYGIPGQTVTDWEADVRQACAPGISHLSAYALSIEEGTVLAGSGMHPPDDAESAEMWQATGQMVADYGMARYEISNYARPGRECRHNDRIWHGASYLGLGPGASSFDGVLRWTQPANLERWLNGEPAEEDRLSPEERACEQLAFGMRTVNGWNLDEFFRLTGYTIQQLRGETVADLQSQGLVELTANVLRPTEKGLLFGDTVALALL